MSPDRHQDPKRLKDSHTNSPGTRDAEAPDPENTTTTTNVTEPESPNATIPMEEEKTESTDFTTVVRPYARPPNPRKIDHTRYSTPCMNNRPHMVYWKYRISAEPNNVKDGNVEKFFRARLRDFYNAGKKRDPTFVLYKYEPQINEADAILDTGYFPKSFKELQGEGPSNRYKNGYFFGLRTYNSKGKQMTLYLEMRVGYTDRELPKLMREWTKTIIPLPYLTEKDLQAPHTVEIGFLFMCNPFMRDRPVQKVLKEIFTNVTIQEKEPPISFAVSQRWINDGNFSAKTDERIPPLQQKRGLHIEALLSDRTRTKAYVHNALKQDAWKRYTNSSASLLPSYRDAEDRERARTCINRHLDAMKSLDYAYTDAISNPDHRNQAITRPGTDKPTTLRELVMSIETDVEVVTRKDGERVTKKVKDKLFLSLDEAYRTEKERSEQPQQSKHVLVFPKAYGVEARKVVSSLYLHIAYMIANRDLNCLADAKQDVGVWFTETAITAGNQMEIIEGQVYTEESLLQKEAMDKVASVQWYISSEETEPHKGHNVIDRTPKKPVVRFDNGDTDSIHTNVTTATNVASTHLKSVMKRAQDMAPRDVDLSVNSDDDEESEAGSASNSDDSLAEGQTADDLLIVNPNKPDKPARKKKKASFQPPDVTPEKEKGS